MVISKCQTVVLELMLLLDRADIVQEIQGQICLQLWQLYTNPTLCAQLSHTDYTHNAQCSYEL